MSIRILLVDDHTILRDALRQMLSRVPDISVIGDASNCADALRLSKDLVPDVILMDVSMPGIDGIETTRSLLKENPGAKVLALSAYLDKGFVDRMLEAGAVGYISKTADDEELIRGIRAVAQGRGYFCSKVSAQIADSVRRSQPQTSNIPRLGKREGAVLAFLAEGRSSKEIASAMHIAEGTVIAHRRNISRKLGIHSIAELTKYAIRQGFTSS